jgi:hypothetical protein
MDLGVMREVLYAHVEDDGLSITFGPQADYKDAYGKKIPAIKLHKGQQLELDLTQGLVSICETESLHNVHAKGFYFKLWTRTVVQQKLYKTRHYETYGYEDGAFHAEGLEVFKLILQQQDSCIQATIE